MQKLLIAFGGNAISSPKRQESFEKRFLRLKKAVSQLKPIAKKYKLIVTHGNGSDIGNLRKVLPLALDTLDALTQGQLGYWLQQAVQNVLRKKAITVVTRVLVDPKDPAFKKPSKPIGISHKGKRKLVASPKPIKIIEGELIKDLAKKDWIVIACGGGGIPVVQKRGQLKGIEAVIDKDLCAVKLAELVRADFLLILTNVDGVYINFRKRSRKKLRRLSIAAAKKYLREGQFGEGSMKPKIEACIQFLRVGGKKCFIGPYDKAAEILKGRAGTVVG